jgi:hypothetical protein
MPVLPPIEVGQAVLVAPSPEDHPWRMTVDVVQDGHITLAVHDDEHLPDEWADLTEVNITCLGRYAVYVVHMPVVRVGDTRMVVGRPDDSTPYERRAYARVFSPVPASCMVLEADTNKWVTFDADVRDLGGGGCSFLAGVVPPDGATVVMSFAVDDAQPVVLVARVLPREALPTIGKPLTRLEYLLVRESDRDRILRYVLLALARHRKTPLHVG